MVYDAMQDAVMQHLAWLVIFTDLEKASLRLPEEDEVWERARSV